MQPTTRTETTTGPSAAAPEWETSVRIFTDTVKVSRKLRYPDGSPRPRSGGGKRGRIRGLSKAATGRLRFLLQNCGRLPYVLHLTYPLDFPTDGARVKLHWKAIREWLVHRGLGGVWVLEFQERGAPHFMVLLDGAVEPDAVSARWAAIVNSGDPEHLRSGTRLEKVRKPSAMVHYMAKVLDPTQKQVPEGYGNVGRMWGSFGGVKAEPLQVLQGSREELAPVVRSLRNLENAGRRERSQRLPPGKRVRPLPDNGVSGWTAPGLAPAALRCVERLGLLDPSSAEGSAETPLARTVPAPLPAAEERGPLPILRAPRAALPEDRLQLQEDRREAPLRRGQPRDLIGGHGLHSVSAGRHHREPYAVKRLTSGPLSLRGCGRPPPPSTAPDPFRSAAVLRPRPG